MNFFIVFQGHRLQGWDDGPFPYILKDLLVMVRTEVHLSIGGMSEAYLFESLPSENVTSQESKNLKRTLQAVKLLVAHCIVR